MREALIVTLLLAFLGCTEQAPPAPVTDPEPPAATEPAPPAALGYCLDGSDAGKPCAVNDDCESRQCVATQPEAP